MHLRCSVCAKKKKSKKSSVHFCPGRCQTVCTCEGTCRGHRSHLEKREQRETAEMKQRTKDSRSAPRHCYFKRFSSKTEDGEQCGAQSTCSERSAGSSTVSSFSEQKKGGRRGGIKEHRGEQEGGLGWKIDTSRDKAPHPQEALVVTAPLAPQRRCDAKKHASTWPELEGALCALCSFSSPHHHHPPHAAIFHRGKKGKETRRLRKRGEPCPLLARKKK